MICFRHQRIRSTLGLATGLLIPDRTLKSVGVAFSLVRVAAAACSQVHAGVDRGSIFIVDRLSKVRVGSSPRTEEFASYKAVLDKLDHYFPARKLLHAHQRSC